MASQMAAEIAEQPQAVAETLVALDQHREEIARLGRGRDIVLFVARGSSDNAAHYGRYLLESTSGRLAAMASPSIATHYAATVDLRRALVVSVSQSGSTDEIVTTQGWARANGAATIAVTNTRDSPLASEADVALVTRAGPELAVPATKTYTTQCAVMGLLAEALALTATTLRSDLSRVPDAISSMIAEPVGVHEAASLLAQRTTWLATGRGLTGGTALETALKLEETTLRPVRGLSYADLRHGPISVVDSSVTVIVVAPPMGQSSQDS